MAEMAGLDAEFIKEHDKTKTMSKKLIFDAQKYIWNYCFRITTS
jgi:hypothetical protein